MFKAWVYTVIIRMNILNIPLKLGNPTIISGPTLTERMLLLDWGLTSLLRINLGHAATAKPNKI